VRTLAFAFRSDVSCLRPVTEKFAVIASLIPSLKSCEPKLTALEMVFVRYPFTYQLSDALLRRSNETVPSTVR